MSKILVVDDDALVLELYQRKFQQEGYEVATAPDGLEGVKAIRTTKPDLVVLDLMMPKLTGVEVLKFVRSDNALKDLPVIILTNGFMAEASQAADRLGVQGSLLKAQCRPTDLLTLVGKILSSHQATKPPAATPPATKPAPVAQDAATAAPQKATTLQNEFTDRVPEALTKLRAICQAFARATDQPTRVARLEDLYGRARQITSIAGLAEHPMVALFSGAFEALLFELYAKPNLINPSTLRTVVSAVDFLGVLFDKLRTANAESPLNAELMVVDDDPISNRIVVDALKRANLKSRSEENPLQALNCMREKHYDLVLLDIEMPGIDGFDMCKKIRQLPGYLNTPVIYVTGHSDFENRAKGILSGGDDLIAKPIIPMELAVKIVTHLLRSRLSLMPLR